MASVNPNDLKNLVRTQGGALGLDDASSAIIIQNMNAGTLPMCGGSPFTDDEDQTDDFRIIKLGFDASSSMQPVADDVIDSVNSIVIPGLLGGAADQVGAIRIGGLRFNSRVTPIWKGGEGGGFHPLRALPQLTKAEYTPQGATALHQGVLDMVTAATTYALTIRQRTGSNPETVLALWTDGANNCAPFDPEDVRKVLSALSPELFTTVFIGFETGERVNFRDIALSMGFRDIVDSKPVPGETPEQMRQRFRHLMRVFSQSLVNRTSKSQVGQSVSAAPGAGTGFWTP